MNQETNNPQDLPPEDIYQEDTQSAPAVAATPAKNFVFLGLFIGIIVLLGFLFFGGKTGTTEEDKPVKTRITSNKAKVIPTIAPPPTIDLPPPISPAAPPKLPDNATVSPFDAQKSPETVKRFKSSMLLGEAGIFGDGNFGGGAGTNSKDKPRSLTEVNDNDPNVGFADSYFNQKDSAFALARNLGDTSRLITQGKIIESVLETPINTDVPGMIRAIVSRDIYAESGKKIMIPKGSRLVGTYNTFVIRGNKRVNVIWSRVIRPDGIDVMIRSGGADQLGRAGVEGDVDNKYSEIFASAFLVSAINIAVGVGTDAMDPNKGNNTSTTSTGTGTTTSNNSATHDAALSAVDLFGNAGKNLVNGFLNLKPTITIDQGTRVNVFVNRDLIFPASMSNEIRIIQ